MPVIVLTNHYPETPLSIVTAELPSGFDLVTLEAATKECLLGKAAQADYFLASGRLPIDKDVVDAATKLKMVQRTGVGTDTIDFKALEARNIPFYVNRGVNAQSVAEHAVLLILATLRRLTAIDASVKRGEWRKQELGLQTHELSGKTVGLIGIGNIGRKAAGMLRAFGARIVYSDIAKLSPAEESQLGVSFLPQSELLRKSDIVSLHCALTESTRGMIGKEEIASMKRGAIIVNTSRGPLIDQPSLVSALESGHLKAAGLDAFAKEPIESDHPLLSMPNVILTPHVGGVTYESFASMMREAMANIKAFEEGDLTSIENKKLSA